MLISIADVPRWYAERRASGTIAARLRDDTLNWNDLERGPKRRAREGAQSLSFAGSIRGNGD